MPTVFVTGATGVLGRATLPRLIAAGYSVRALSRSSRNDAVIRELGAIPVRGDLFDSATLREAIGGSEAILHLATRIPPTPQIRHRQAWRENDRIRAAGAHALVDAALNSGVTVFVYPSFAFVYPDSGDAWIDAATTPVAPADMMRSTIAAEEEVARFAAAGGEPVRRGVSLRLAALYGPDLPSAQEQIAMARRGLTAFGARPDGFTPMLWIDDAASALVAALDGAPSGVYDVVDDEPLRQRDLKPALAAAAGRRRLLSLPSWLIARMGGEAGGSVSRSLRISNARFKQASGWSPAVPSAREGMRLLAVNGPAVTAPHVPLNVQAGLWLLFVFTLAAGAWQQFAPRSFYDDFPGFGLHWVSVDGPFNEHLMRDLGGANLALALILGYVAARPSVGLVRAAMAAILVAQVPHFVYHLTHLGVVATSLDRILQTFSLTLFLVIPLLVLLRSGDISATSMPTPQTPKPASPSSMGKAQGLIRST